MAAPCDVNGQDISKQGIGGTDLSGTSSLAETDCDPKSFCTIEGGEYVAEEPTAVAEPGDAAIPSGEAEDVSCHGYTSACAEPDAVAPQATVDGEGTVVNLETCLKDGEQVVYPSACPEPDAVAPHVAVVGDGTVVNLEGSLKNGEQVLYPVSEESRVFLENVLQAAAEREAKEDGRVETDTQDQDGGQVNELLDGDGNIAGTNYRVVTEVGIQANDYDIERRSGRLPPRHRVIPAKFRDYKNPADSDEERDDSDFDPDEVVVTSPRRKRQTAKRGRGRGRGRGRPRKEHSHMTEAVESIEALGPIVKTSNGFKCPCCSKTFQQSGNLKSHMLSHTNLYPFKCDVEGCIKAFRSNESLRRHKMGQHLGIKPYSCETCKKLFASTIALKEHQSIHDNTKPYVCDVCHRSFRQISCFRRHQVTHSSDTPFACDVCGRRFSMMVYLRSHRKVHTGERPWQCDKCPKAFAHQSDLNRHKIIHSGVKPYECDVCHARFSDKSSRRRHARNHETPTPFECPICGEKLKRENMLRIHMSRWHAGAVLPLGSAATTDPSSLPNDTEQATNVVNIMVDQEEGDLDPEENQKNIVSLIQNLNTGYVVQEVEIASPANQLEGEEVAGDTQEGETRIQELSNVQTDDVQQTVIAITELQQEGKGDNSSPLPECAYQIIQELADGGEGGRQIFQIQYQTSDNQLETSLVEVADSTPPPDPAQEMAKATLSETSTDGLTYVKEPDFGSQDYFNWLSHFTELCKVLTMPLERHVFQRISQVHKSITDFMACPSGVLNDKDNFRVLMNISKDLNSIVSSHLAYVMESMETNS